jgi:hypothetical protein
MKGLSTRIAEKFIESVENKLQIITIYRFSVSLLQESHPSEAFYFQNTTGCIIVFPVV